MSLGQNKNDYLSAIPNILTGNDLEDVLQQTSYVIPSDGSTNLSFLYKPIPMKSCPPDSKLVGADFITVGDKIIGVKSILCERNSTRASFFTNPLNYPGNSGGYDSRFSQDIGDVGYSGTHSVVSSNCPIGKRVEGVWMYRKYDSSANLQHRTSQLRFMCR